MVCRSRGRSAALRFGVLRMRLRGPVTVISVLAVLALAAPAGATLILDSGNSDSSPTNGNSSHPAFSGDGAYVAFLSTSTDIIGGSDGTLHVFRHGEKDGSRAFVDFVDDSLTELGDAAAASCEGCVA